MTTLSVINKNTSTTISPLSRITNKQLAELAKVSVRTVGGWRYRKQGPRYVKLPNGTIRYPLKEALHFLRVYQHQNISQITEENNEQGTTNEL